jgi:O-antigen ligase
MADNMESHFDSRAFWPGFVRLPEWATVALLGLAAGATAALFVTVNWTIAVVAALVVVAFSATENETFFLLLILLLPINWVRSSGAIRDVTTPLRLLVILGFFGGRILRGNLNWRHLFASSITRVSGLLFGIFLASVVFGPVGWGHDSLAQLYRLVSWIGFYLFALAWIDSARRLRRVLAALLGSVCLLGLFSILQEAVGGYTSFWFYLNPPGPDSLPWNGRAPSLLAYSTSLAGCVELLLPLALASWAVGSGRLKKLGGCGSGLGVCSLLFSQSIGGMLALGFVLALAIYHFVKSWRRRALLLCGLAVVAGGLYVGRRALNPAHFAVSVNSLLPDVMGRLLQFEAAWTTFIRHPILGVGFGNFGAVSSALMPQAVWNMSVSQIASNLCLNLLAETGIIGLAAFLYLIFVAARKAWSQMKIRSWELGPVFAFGAFGAVSTVLVHGLVDYLFFYCPQYGTLLWLLLALMVVSSWLRKRAGTGAARGDFQIEGRRSKPECA